MMQKIMNFGWILLIITTIIIHFLKIINIYFKPSFLNKYEIFSNINISRAKLSLYYLLTMLVLFKILIEKMPFTLSVK